MFDALLFVWLLGVMAVLQELHELKIIPALFKTY
jgi:hypothetical protein